MSRRDGEIVAWHEVPGTASPQKSRPVGYGVIRAGVRMIRQDQRAWISSEFQTSETLLGNRAMAHSALISRRFRKRSITSSSSSNIIGHELFKKSI